MSVPADLVFRNQIAADMFDGLVGSGMAVAAMYTPPGGGTAVPCDVVISRGIAPAGSFGSVPSNKIVIKLRLAQVPAPKRGGTIAEPGQTFTLVAPFKDDGSLADWEVQ